MPVSTLDSAKKKTIGTKQTLKAVEKGLAESVYVAADADQHVLKPMSDVCKSKNIPLFKVESMRKLGEACGIEVGCASAAILKE
jgi:large subunit ribosomal protein L7A